MAFGQIDPARLDGEALRRWYLRSPVEIEDERRKAAANAYDAYFLPRSEATRPAADGEAQAEAARGFDRDGFIWSQVGERRWSGSREPADRHRPTRDNRTYQLAATAPSDFWNDWTPCNTLSCHGRPAPPAPPRGGGESPLPPPYYPRTGGGSGSGAGGGRREWSDKPECNQQFEKDREICRKAKRAECWANQNERLANCSKPDGTIGDPPLRFGPPGR